MLNTTVGIAGFFDVASRVGLDKSDADTGRPWRVWRKARALPGIAGAAAADVRDAVGFAADSFMDPLSWFITPIGADFGRTAAHRINERADNMKQYDDVEDTSLDLYAAVRNGYLQRRQKSIRDAIRDRDRTWERITDPFEHREKTTLGEKTPSE